ncbi:unnamed protein product [Bursaphelenchus okinawaensis]|uniref:Anaphase-promoting complex subunit 4 n=1 Tax=Bursaphelenchus okinawaensis TaxID=465554 RepID=A0A811L610_9BILA|nr:unnamed protein product [Bursaphelenchus okinawaensis]CAG9117270.1 unnamed protein product [Bursaphelenchus okinawaensis]
MSDSTGFFLKQTTFAHSEHRTKFKVRDSIWNPVLDVLALASTEGEICLKRVHWKTGWKKKIAPEAVFYTKWSRNTSDLNKEDVGAFSCFAWSPDGSVLAVCFELGVCHLLDVNDGTILYTLRMNGENYTHLKWFKLDCLSSFAKDITPKTLFNYDGSLGPVKSDHLKTKESDSCRDHYKIVQGIEHYCHGKIQKALLDTVLIAAGPKEEFVGFDVYMGGVLLIKSVVIDDKFMSPVCDRISTEVSDICLLPNSDIQIALSTMSFGTPNFDQDCGFEIPTNSEGPSAGSTVYLVDFDVGLKNEKRVKCLAKVAARTCHIFHLMTNIRETFLKTVSDWESQSEIFHSNIFKKLFENYQSQTSGKVSDFCLDFVGYILTGHAPDAFAHSFFRDIRQKQWKPAKDFVMKHIPYLTHIVKRHLIVGVGILYVHISALIGQLNQYEESERLKLFDGGLPDFDQAPSSSDCVEECQKALVLTSLLRRKLKQLLDVAGENWADLKYMLQLFCTHPDNEGLEIEIDNDGDGILRERDFELLIKFVANALVQPEMWSENKNWFDFIELWMKCLKSDDELSKEYKGRLVCNPNWLKHRTFDRIAPILGVCNDIPAMNIREEEVEATKQEREGLNSTKFKTELSVERIATVSSCLHYLFDTLEGIYTKGTTEVCSEFAKPLQPKKHVVIEYCHPEAATKINIFNWNDVKLVHEFMQKPVVESTLAKIQDFEACFDADFNSLIVLHRRSATTLQLYASIDIRSEYNNCPYEFCATAPKNLVKLAKFGVSHECNQNKSTLLNMFMNGKFHVSDFEVYGAGSMYFMADVCEQDQSAGANPVYLVKCDVLGQMCFVDDLPITHSNDGVLNVAPRRAVGVLFEREFELVKWFDLEMNSLNQPENDENVSTGFTNSFSFSPLKYKREVRDNESMDLSQTSILGSQNRTLRQIKTEPIEEDEEDEDIPQPVNLDDYAIYIELDSSPSPETPNRDGMSSLGTPRRFLSTSPMSEWRLVEDRDSPVNMRTRSISSNSDSASHRSSINTVDPSDEDEDERRERLEQEEQAEGDPENVSENSNHVLEEVAGPNQDSMDFAGSDHSEQYYSFQEGDQQDADDDTTRSPGQPASPH